MNIEDARKLRPGDEVYWNDPDSGKCSTMLTIREITIIADTVVRIRHDAGELECFAYELE